MPLGKSEINNLIVKYLEQQKQVYGDGYVISREKFNAFKNSPDGPARKKIDITTESKPSMDNTKKELPESLKDYFSNIKECQKCSLSQTRTNFVFGVGNPDADLLIVGEAPGAEEDRLGEPFVGRAGKLLNKILDSINFKREDVFIGNILKCRPPGNRDPLEEEVRECEPYLHEQIKIIQPKVLLALGRISAQTLLKSRDNLTSFRGKIHYYQGIPMLVTYHPAALLRNPNWKYPTWDDVRYLKNIYEALKKGENPENIVFEKRAN